MAQGLGTVRRFPSTMTPVIKLLLESNVGIVQMPCPEKEILGLIRAPRNKDEMPKEIMNYHAAQLAKSICTEIEDYIKNQFKIVAIIGKRGSPVCGVRECWTSKDTLSQEPGFLMKALMNRLEERDIVIPFIDFEKDDELISIKAIQKLL